MRTVGIALFSFFLLGFSSCSSSSPWVYRKVVADCPTYSSALLYHPPCNQFTGIEVQFLRGKFGRQGYLNVYSRCVPPLTNDPNRAAVVLQIGEQHYRYSAFRMKGEQRLLLPREATDQMIEALLAGLSITIYLEGFSTEICPKNFPSLYRQFTSVPIQHPAKVPSERKSPIFFP